MDQPDHVKISVKVHVNNFVISQNIFRKIYKIQQKVVKNVFQLRLSGHFQNLTVINDKFSNVFQKLKKKS